MMLLFAQAQDSTNALTHILISTTEFSIRLHVFSTLHPISWRFCHDCCRIMKEEQQKGISQIAIEQFADVRTSYAAETFAAILYSRSEAATRIMANATN
jgi:hypothetical protein